jgi:branched-chain amino acid transport system ATP-binding protein
MDTILDVRDIGISFGSYHVLKSLTFSVRKGEVLGVIGPNGAGKTVMLNILSGILRPSKGEVFFQGQNITSLPVARRCRMGIGRTFQVPRPFEKMTVLENIMVGSCYGDLKSEKEARARALEIVELIGLGGKKMWLAGKLGLLDRKRLEMGRALASNPRLLLFDEVAGGLTESEVGAIFRIVKLVKEQGISIVWIEHVLQAMREGTDRVICLAGGKIIADGAPEEVMRCREVKAVYLGEEEDDERQDSFGGCGS